ncbi:MAG: NAD-dependent epimerase/dehydratase family protein [Caldilineaceae bacterium]
MQAEHSPTYASALATLRAQPRTWLVTGAAGFIGSHLVEALLGLGQSVIGLDNFATGRRQNLEAMRATLETHHPGAWARYRFVEGDITDPAACQAALAAGNTPVDYLLHHAALGSVPRSMSDPLSTHQANVTGTLNMLLAARDARVRRFVYASSSSVYGDEPAQPKVVGHEGRPLSPYALSKSMNEQQGDLFARVWGMSCVGLRYFNVFGPLQDPNGPYAAVIPRWVATLLAGERCTIHGDGTTSRDFCFVANVVQANILAAMAPMQPGQQRICNIAVGQRTSLTELHTLIRDGLLALDPTLPIAGVEPIYGPFRPGDIAHSLADISDAQTHLGYAPTHGVAAGLQHTLARALAAHRAGL